MIPSRFLLALAACLPAALCQLRRDDSSSSQLTDVVQQLPACGLQCLVTGLSNSTCTTTECICSDNVLLANVTTCVEMSCTIKNQLKTKNLTDTACGVPVRDAGIGYNILNISLACVTSAVFLLRIGYKLFVAQIDLGYDDWFIVLTILSGTASTIMTSLGTVKNGLGRDIWALDPDMITSFVYWFYHMEWAYFLNLTCLKMSLLFFYLRIFPSKTVRLILWVTIGYNALWGLGFIIVAIFQCQPIDYYWTNWDGEHQGKCLDSNALGWANAATSIALDVWMVAIPLSQLGGLQLHFKKKIGVAIMFCTGTFVTIISIVRLQSLITFANSNNPSWDNLKVSQWSTIEVNVGILCACMPTLRLILVKMFPRLTSTIKGYASNKSWGDDRYATGGSRSNRSQARGGVPVGGVGVGVGGGAEVEAQTGNSAHAWSANPTKGIHYQRSYAIQYDDVETSSQVHLRDLDHKGLDASPSASASVSSA